MFRRSLICLLLVTPAVRAAVQSVTVDPVSVQLQGSRPAGPCSFTAGRPTGALSI